jgi:hypothetical protein
MYVRSVAERGIYPAVDPLDSTSRIMDPNVIGAEHYGVARGVQKILQVYAVAVMQRQTEKVNRRELQDMSSLLFPCLRRWLFTWSHFLVVVTRTTPVLLSYIRDTLPLPYPPSLSAYSADTQSEPDNKNFRACLRSCLHHDFHIS